MTALSPDDSGSRRRGGAAAGRFTLFGYDFSRAGRGPLYIGLLFVLPLLLTAGSAAFWAPLNSAAIANGEVVLNLNRKQVQHLEGGIIDAIHVREGQAVTAGDVLLVIRDVTQRSRLNALRERLGGARALRARLIGEKADRRPDYGGVFDGLALPEARRRQIISLQTDLFDARREDVKLKTALIRSRQQQTRDEITGLQAGIAADSRQLELAAQQLQAVNRLFAGNNERLDNKLELEKTMAMLQGRIGGNAAAVARLQQSIPAGDTEIFNLRNEYRKSVLDELQQTELSIRDMQYELIAITDALERTLVRAPVGGRVMDVQFHTRGAVVSPGERILDIVPGDDRMIVEARLNPNDIDLVAQGTPVKLLLSAYKAKKVPKLDGVVDSVSADILSDPASGEKYFLTRIAVDDAGMEKLRGIELYPGMPVQAFFVGGERTIGDYLLSPITDAMYRAFREE